MTSRYDVLDVFKLVAAVFVVGIHAWPLPDFNSNMILFQGIGRFAVPFFLLTSGFLLHKKLTKIFDVAEQKMYTWQYIKRLFQFYIAWWIVYLWLTPLRWGGVYRFEGQQGIQLLKLLFNQYFVNFFTGSTFIGSWYISSTIIGVIIVFVVFNRISLLGQLMIGSLWLTILLVVLLFGNKSIFIISMLKHLPYILPAETFLVAVPFLIFGRVIAQYEKKLKKVPIKFLLVITIVLQPLIAKEIFHWRFVGTAISNEQLIFADILAVVVLLIAINEEVRKVIIPSAKYLRNLSSFMYMGQFGLLILAAILHKYFNFEFSNWRMYTMILLVLFLLFDLLQRVENKKYTHVIRYLW